jgi:imidazolonepropionase
MSPARTSTLVTGIAELVTNDRETAGASSGSGGRSVSDTTAGVGTSAGSDRLGVLTDAALLVTDGLVSWVGPASSAPEADRVIDVGGRAVLPGFVDSHAHLVFAGDRSAEFVARMTGERYDGGGIATTMAATRSASDDDLRALVAARVVDMRAQGTTTVEIKSGYGLTVDDEARALRIAREFTPETTFLGAHVVPPDARGERAAYVDLVTGPMLEACAPHARWIDVFCEPASPHAFTGEEARRVLEAGIAAGLLPRVHGNQLGPGPGVQLAVDLGAASVDHCTHLDDADIDALAGSAATTVATLLPGVEFSTRSPYPDGRRLIDAGVTVALATDCNPGTCYSSSMPLMIALAVREMGMTPAEAVWAATAGGAQAMRRSDIGRLAVGARADLCVLDAPSHAHLAYRPGVPIARTLDVD